MAVLSADNFSELHTQHKKCKQNHSCYTCGCDELPFIELNCFILPMLIILRGELSNTYDIK